MPDQESHQSTQEAPPQAEVFLPSGLRGREVSPVSELPPQAAPHPSVSSAKAKDADREARRREHFERALAASGKAKTAPTDAEEDETEADPAEPKEDETEEQKSERLAKLDKVKSHKHLAKVKETLANEAKVLDQRERDHEKRQAQDKRINDAVTAEYGPIAQARVDYGKKDYRTSKAAVEHLFGDKFENIARNFWNATKDGLATADLSHEVQQLKAKLAERDQKTTEQTEAAAKETESKQLRSTFDKALKAHPLFESGDSELQKRAFERWRESWDEDIGEYSLSKKKAADQIYQSELERAQRLTGRKPKPLATRETRDGTVQTKPLREMTREEKRKAHLERALRETAAARRNRERHA
jgi:hypothetical protein